MEEPVAPQPRVCHCPAPVAVVCCLSRIYSMETISEYGEDDGAAQDVGVAAMRGAALSHEPPRLVSTPPSSSKPTTTSSSFRRWSKAPAGNASDMTPSCSPSEASSQSADDCDLAADTAALARLEVQPDRPAICPPRAAVPVPRACPRVTLLYTLCMIMIGGAVKGHCGR